MSTGRGTPPWRGGCVGWVCGVGVWGGGSGELANYSLQIAFLEAFWSLQKFGVVCREENYFQSLVKSGTCPL